VSGYAVHDHPAGVENQATNGETAYGAPPLLTFPPNGITITARLGLAKTARGCGMRPFRLSLVLLAAAVVAVLALGRGPAESAFPGANGKIAFTSLRDGNAEIYVMNADGSDQTNLTKNPAADEYVPAWSPDGSKIAFSSNRDGDYEIYVMNADDGSGQTNLTNYPAVFDGYPAWSPDGSKIAFASDRDGDGDIYVVNVDANGVPIGAPTNLTTDSAAWDADPAWSPDGSKIAFITSRVVGYHEVYVMNADGSNPTNLTNSPVAHDEEPAWSPDGTKIAFQSSAYRDMLPRDIYVVNADGSGDPTNLTNTGMSDEDPAWSPDGTKIAFARDDIYVMNADGSGDPTRLTTDPQRDFYPDWQPAAGSSSQDMPVGTNVSAHLDGVTMTCSQVTSAGKATLTTTKGGPAPPDEYGIIPGAQGDMLYYDISTTADCEPPITLCFTYDDTKLICKESDLKLAKHVGSDWKYLANQTIDTVNNIICGEVDSLSLFLMLGPVPVGVGGIVELLAPGEAPAAASGSASGGDHTLPAAAAAAGAVVVLAAAGWYARRRVR
jgi:Tol biopolymer transport system component